MTHTELEREIHRTTYMQKLATEYLIDSIECGLWDWADLWSDDLAVWRRTQKFWEEQNISGR